MSDYRGVKEIECDDVSPAALAQMRAAGFRGRIVSGEELELRMQKRAGVPEAAIVRGLGRKDEGGRTDG
jgi:hypothetical protein